MTLRRRLTVQPPRLRIVLRASLSVAEHRTEDKLRACVTLRRRQPVEPPRLRTILRPALPRFVHRSEPTLRFYFSSRHRRAEPLPLRRVAELAVAHGG
eukprot:3447036-Prymnesium_polylepis.2